MSLYKAITQHFRHSHIAMTPPLSPKHYFSGAVVNQNKIDTSAQLFPLNLPDSQLQPTFNGSAALYQAAVHLNLGNGDAVLLPAYGCGAEINPFTSVGCELHFFDIDNELNADTQQIAQLLKQHKNIKMLLLTHYLGFAQPAIKTIQQLCIDTKTALVEDCAHALFGTHAGTPLGSFGHCAIFSPRKTVGLTDGGLLVINSLADQLANATAWLEARQEDPLRKSTKNPDLIPYLQRLCYSMLQYYRSGDSVERNRLTRVFGIALLSIPAAVIKLIKRAGGFKKANWATADIEGIDAVPIYNTSMSNSMFSILKQTDSNIVKTNRQKNYRLWLSAMNDTSLINKAQPVFPTLPETCCPLYFPLRVNDPAKLVRALESYDIESFNWWSKLHPSINWEDYPVAKKMKHQIIALPLHHQMSAAQVSHAATCVRTILSASDDL